MSSAGTMKKKLFVKSCGKKRFSNAVNIGNLLNLFKVLGSISSKDKPVLPEELAKAAGCKERFEEKFWIAEENLADLTTDSFELVTNGMMATLLKPLDQVVECFKKEGPYGLEYSQFTEFQSFMSIMSKSLHEKHVVADMLPAVGNGIVEKLEAGGIRVLDVGCGNGFHSFLLAEQYPKANFVAFDIGEDAIQTAKKRKRKSGAAFNNLEFIQCDAGAIPATWNESFDLVLIFDACHDQCRPDLCIQEIHRVLKPNGIFAMVEISGSSNVLTDREAMGPLAAWLYECSMLHCIPVGSNRHDALCFGAMWGIIRAAELIKKCGFKEVEVVKTPYFPINVMYVSKKIE